MPDGVLERAGAFWAERFEDVEAVDVWRSGEGAVEVWPSRVRGVLR